MLLSTFEKKEAKPSHQLSCCTNFFGKYIFELNDTTVHKKAFFLKGKSDTLLVRAHAGLFLERRHDFGAKVQINIHLHLL